MHPPKRELFDVHAGTNTDPKGIVRQVQTYSETAFGLYLARPTPGREQFHYLESWLLPAFGLRITDFHFCEGHDRDQDFYLDIVDIDTDPWRTTDLYLDISVKIGAHAELLDLDELLLAHADKLIDTSTAERAVRTAAHTLAQLEKHDYDLAAWLATAQITLHWQRHPQ